MYEAHGKSPNVCVMQDCGEPTTKARAQAISALPDLLDVVDAMCKQFALAGIAAKAGGNHPAEDLHARAVAAWVKAGGAPR